MLKDNELVTFISPKGGECEAQLRQETWFSMGTFDAGQKTTYHLKGKDTGVYFFIIEGDIKIAGEALNRRDGIGVWDTDEVSLEFTSKAKVLGYCPGKVCKSQECYLWKR